MEISVLLATAMLYGFMGFTFGMIMGVIKEWNKKVAAAIIAIMTIILGSLMVIIVFGSDPGTATQEAASSDNWIGQVFVFIGTWIGISFGETTYEDIFE